MNIPELSIRLLPIGLGDCILIRFPDSSWGMIDCGAGAAKRDAAAMAVEMLDQEPPLDTPVRFVVATHPDTDHVGRIPAFLRFCKRRVEEVFHCGVDRELDRGAKEYRYLDEIQRLSEQGRIGPVKTIQAGQRIELSSPIEGLQIRCLHPDAATVERGAARTASDRNNASVVLQLSFFGVTVLLPGDLEHHGWASIVESPDFLPPRVVKVSHHGAMSGLPADVTFQKVFAVQDQRCWALLSTSTGDPSKPHVDVLQTFWNMPNWQTRCTGWSPHCRLEDRTPYPFASDDERCPRSLREALLAPLSGAQANLYLDAGCCVDDQLVIQADGTIRHSVESKSCSERITARSQPIPVA